MTTLDDNAAILKRNHPRYKQEKMFVGQRVSGSQVTMAGAPDGMTWVRRDDASREQTAVMGYYGVANHEVWVGPDADGSMAILRPSAGTVRKFGVAAVNAAMTPPKPAELNKDILPNENLQQFRVHPSGAGSLEVKVEPGYYYAPDGTLNITELATQDLSGNVPSASGGFDRFRWVKVSLDPDDGTFTFTDGTPSVSITDIDLPALAAITVPAGEIPIYGVKLRTGQTAFDNPKEQFYRLDTLIQAMPHVRYGEAVPITIASGAITLGTASHYVISAESSTTDDLDTITGGIEGQSIRLTAATGHTITLRDGVDNLVLPDGVNIALDDTKYVDLILRGADWYAIGGGGGGDASTVTYTPSTPGDWSVPPADVAEALDALAAGGGGATFYGPKLIYELTLGSNGTFDTNTADPQGRSGIAGYNDLSVRIVGRNSSATDRTIDMTINTDTTAGNYQQQIVYGTGASTGNALRAYADARTLTGIAGGGTDDLSTIEIYFYDYANTARFKHFHQTEIRRDSSTTHGNLDLRGTWESNAAITRLRFATTTDTNFEAGTKIQIWGWGEISVGAADLDIGSIGAITPATGDKVVLGDVSNSDNTGYATIEDVLELATYEMTSTATGNIDDLDIGDAPIVELRMNNASTATIRGLVGSGKGGQIVKIFSVGAGNVELAHQNAGSTAANRLINAVTGMNTPLAAGFGTATYVYDATTQRWRLQSHNQGATIAYTPTWTSTGTNPTLGNSTLTGTYLISGNQISGRLDFTYGSSGVSSGTGVWLFSTPTAISVIGGGGSANDVGVAGYNVTIASNSSTTFSLTAYNTQVNGSNPFTWGNTDTIRLAWFGVAT